MSSSFLLGQIFDQLDPLLLLLLPLLILPLVLRSPWFKGVLGEFLVNLSAKFLLDREKYHLLKNVTLPTEDGTTQIDHVIVSEFGVFVVETKNMKGWIFGDAKQRKWTQKIYKHSTTFQNPLDQNYKHLKTLESLLGLNAHQLHSVIVFVGNSTFKTTMPENVTHGGGYVRFIRSKREKVLSPAQVIELVKKIEDGRLTPSWKTNRDHVKHVKSIVANKETLRNARIDQKIVTTPSPMEELTEDCSNNPVCPRCGGVTRFKEPGKGQPPGKKFFACSKFPQCLGITALPS